MNATHPVFLTVIIPALNEAPGIAATVRTTLSVFPGTRVIVGDSGSFDDTAEVAARAGAAVIASARGRGLQLAAGLRLAFTDWRLFLHADTIRPQYAALLVRDFALRPRRLARIESLLAAMTTSARPINYRGHLSQRWLKTRRLVRYLMGTPPARLAEIYRSPAELPCAAAEPAVPLLYETKRSKR